MKDYKIDYSYLEPRWGTIELQAADATDAEGAAMDYIDKSFPEAEEASVDKVTEIS